MMFEELLYWILYWVLAFAAVLVSLTFHEVSHGFVSYKLGDPTAKEAGRLSLNPFRHLDLVGTICMLLVHFGWAKPVPINPAFYKNKKQGIVLTALAGPITNLLLALVSMILLRLVGLVPITSQVVFYLYYPVLLFLNSMVTMNVAFAVFNVLPISPLDGSKVLYALLPDRYYYKILQYERYGILALFLLVFLGNRIPQLDIIGKIINFLTDKVLFVLNSVVNLLF